MRAEHFFVSFNFLSEQGKVPPHIAFDVLKRKAQYMYGHGGYTGTIAEKDGFTDVTDDLPETVMTGEVGIKDWAYQYSIDNYVQFGKWGDAIMVEWEDCYYFFGIASS